MILIKQKILKHHLVKYISLDTVKKADILAGTMSVFSSSILENASRFQFV